MNGIAAWRAERGEEIGMVECQAAGGMRVGAAPRRAG